MPYQAISKSGYPDFLRIKLQDYHETEFAATAAAVDFKLFSDTPWNSMEDSATANQNEADNIPGWKHIAAGYKRYHLGACDLHFKLTRHTQQGDSEVVKQQSGVYLYVYFPADGNINVIPPWETNAGNNEAKAKAIVQMRRDPRCKSVYLKPIYDNDGVNIKDISAHLKIHMNLTKQLRDRRPETIVTERDFEGIITTGEAAHPAKRVFFRVGVISERNNALIPALDLKQWRTSYVQMFDRVIDLTAG